MEKENQNKLDFFLKKNKINYKNIKHYIEAFTHMSYSNESKTNSYERLEFLGDCILSYLVGSYIFQKFENASEGTMTRLRSIHVQKKNLASIGKKLEFEKYMFRGMGEIKTSPKPSDSLYEEVFESLVGAIYLDLGLEETRKFVDIQILQNIDDEADEKDPKTKLQENLQSNGSNTAKYKILSQNKVLGANNFLAGVFHDGKKLGEGKGKSKKEAEQNAAKDALTRMAK